MGAQILAEQFEQAESRRIQITLTQVRRLLECRVIDEIGGRPGSAEGGGNVIVIRMLAGRPANLRLGFRGAHR